MNPWRTAIVDAADSGIRIRGYEIGDLMHHVRFADVVFLLHQARLPTPAEARVLDSMLIAIADWSSSAPSCATARLAASGNRFSLSAAVAAGLLAVGNEHGGAGEPAMTMIAAALHRAHVEGLTVESVAERTVSEAYGQGRRLPGLGHRVHLTDPRVEVLFELAIHHHVAGQGMAFMQCLEAAACRRIKPLPMNLDGAMAALLHDMGFVPAAGKLLFLLGRVAGLTAEVSEEHEREKPMRVHFPLVYDGEAPRAFPPTYTES